MWGYNDWPHNHQHHHQRQYVMQVRKFIEAVLEYTQAPKVHVISHSMGVTIARKALHGGFSKADKKPYYIGEPLTSKVDTFISIAGGNMGEIECLNRDGE